ncbi:sulfotransferase family 2 domain-containing protein [Halodurantibacterium flavum]|uniref:Sulfotransferase family 2 domain-containing protein n=1 Tax=Halodurantibacterium flavum TaxID=1382802 RepID=A0ABW4S3Z5_9RHOB
MLVFWNERLVFLATPKTGSTAIEVALESLATVSIQRPPELKHSPATPYQRFLRPYLNRASSAQFEAVALMREPVDWLGSWYRFRRRDAVANQPNSTRDLSFSDFVEAYLRPERPPFANVGAQSTFLCRDGVLGVDRLFRYEDIDSFVNFLEERLNCEVILPRLNVSPKGDLTLDTELRARLQEALSADYALYDAIPQTDPSPVS